MVEMIDNIEDPRGQQLLIWFAEVNLGCDEDLRRILHRNEP